MPSTCLVDQQCDFMYYCSQSICKHQEILPLQIYPSLVYLLIPIATGLCNLSGNSMGMFKIIILMNLLRYTINDATAIIQAVVVGAALPNFIEIIKQKHPNGKTSLVNFNAILILIPCCLYGSTIGSLVQTILPEFTQDVIIFALFIFFSFNFIKKAKKQFQSQSPSGERDSLITIEDTHQRTQHQTQNRTLQIQPKKDEVNSLSLTDTIQSPQLATHPKRTKKSKKLKRKIPKNPEIAKLRKQIKTYEKSIHLRDIVESIIVFIGFEFLVFFVQGKIPYLEFSKCSLYYLFGLILLTFVTAAYLFMVKRQMIQKFDNYKKVKFTSDIDIPDQNVFFRLILGGFGAGLVQGTLGVGAGTFQMTVLLALSLDSRVASATSGYQILFTGSAALIQQFINNDITVQQGGFFFLWTAISGGIVTILLYKMLGKVQEKKMKKILFVVISVLCVISLVLVIPVTIQRIEEIGWNQINKTHYEC